LEKSRSGTKQADSKFVEKLNMHKLLTIAQNTFTEILRQPIYGVLVTCALLLLFLSPSLTMYTMSDDNKLLRDIGLSTLFLTSLFIAIFSASGAIAEEVENKTITTVLTKPVPRPIYIVAKFLGVAAAVALAHFIGTVALLLAIRHGVLETAGDTHDWTVLSAAAAAVLGTLILSSLFNYWFDWKFSSTAMVLLDLFGAGAIVFLSLVNRDWQFAPQENHISMTDVYGAFLLWLAALVIAALALALSTRFSLVVTLSACVGIFLLGLVSDYVFGRYAGTHWWATLGRYLVPNLQVFWISDAIYEGTTVPLRYIAAAAAYAGCYAGAILAIAVALFQRRQAC
jgi:ABC-2 type transport system permease protein